MCRACSLTHCLRVACSTHLTPRTHPQETSARGWEEGGRRRQGEEGRKERKEEGGGKGVKEEEEGKEGGNLRRGDVVCLHSL